MTQRDEDPAVADRKAVPREPGPEAPSLAEDLLLLLFQPNSGTIAGENTLFYVLAGAVLADLALEERVDMTMRLGAVHVSAARGRAPSDDILLAAWQYVAKKPRPVQSVLPAIGPELREPLITRLIERGDIVEKRTRRLFARISLEEGRNGRRAGLVKDIREVLVDGAEPSPRIAALVALIWGSGTLPQFGPEIPWTSQVIARAQELERGNWGAAASAEAVTRTISAIIVGSVVALTTGLRRD